MTERPASGTVDRSSPPLGTDPGANPRAWLLPRPGGVAAGIETAVITLVALGLGLLVDPADPLNTRAGFPWVWFAPVLVALRYGVVPGMASAAGLIAVWYGFHFDKAVETPKFLFLGGLLMTLVCGEYGAAWRNRLRQATAVSAYLEERVARVTRQLYLLRLSHERLEQELLSQPTTLREALVQLRTRLVAATDTSPIPGAESLLAFLAQQCQLEAAALYASDGADRPTFTRVATIGDPPPLAPDDPLLGFALEEGTVAHLRSDAIVSAVTTPHIAIAPVLTGNGRLLGVLAVSRLPFFALNQDTLQLLAVLLGAYADTIVGRAAARAIATRLPEAPEEFTDELARLLRVQRDHGVDSHLVVMRFGDGDRAIEAREAIVRQRRSPDVAWSPRLPGGRAAFINLLPVSGTASVEGYLLRTEAALREAFAAGFADLGIRTFVIPLSDPDPLAALIDRLSPLTGHASGSEAGV